MHEDLILACPRCGGAGVVPGAFLVDTICVLCDGTGEVYEEADETEGNDVCGEQLIEYPWDRGLEGYEEEDDNSD